MSPTSIFSKSIIDIHAKCIKETRAEITLVFRPRNAKGEHTIRKLCSCCCPSLPLSFTSGAAVTGNLTLKASVEPIRPAYDIHYHFVRSIEQSFRWFEGFMNFKFAVRDLLVLSPKLDGMKIVVKAEVGERFLDLIEMGESATIVFNSTLKLSFLGNSPQVYKPGMPFKAYVSTLNNFYRNFFPWGGRYVAYISNHEGCMLFYEFSPVLLPSCYVLLINFRSLYHITTIPRSKGELLLASESMSFSASACMGRGTLETRFPCGYLAKTTCGKSASTLEAPLEGRSSVLR